jgi:hypothetical protein
MTLFNIGLVAHHTRWDRAQNLAEYLKADVVALDYDGKVGAGRNHEICYEWLAESGAPWSVLLEDDAVPIKNFRQELDRVLQAVPPGTGVLSLYLGRWRPPHWQASIAQVISRDEHFFLASELLHHVAVAIRTPLIPLMLDHIRADRRYQIGKLPIDEAVGGFARAAGMPVAYSHPSIVNHDTTLPTVIGRHVSQHPTETGHRPRTEFREAWAFGTRRDWQPSVARIPEPA